MPSLKPFKRGSCKFPQLKFPNIDDALTKVGAKISWRELCYESGLFDAFNTNVCNLPLQEPLIHDTLVSDGAFWLKSWLTKPFPGKSFQKPQNYSTTDQLEQQWSPIQPLAYPHEGKCNKLFFSKFTSVLFWTLFDLLLSVSMFDYIVNKVPPLIQKVHTYFSKCILPCRRRNHVEVFGNWLYML